MIKSKSACLIKTPTLAMSTIQMNLYLSGFPVTNPVAKPEKEPQKLSLK
jgi:hypothetical protein